MLEVDGVSDVTFFKDTPSNKSFFEVFLMKKGQFVLFVK